MQKVIGNKDRCFCGTPVECKADKKGNPAWFNEGTDQKHYNFDTATQKTTCGKPSGQSVPESRADNTKKDFTPQRVDLDALGFEAEFIVEVTKTLDSYTKVALLELDSIADAIEKNGLKPYPALVGMIWNNWCQKKISETPKKSKGS